MMATAYLKEKVAAKPDFALILGSGLGELADKAENATVVPYGDIPGFPVSTAPGHKGNLVFGTLGGKSVVLMQGRVPHLRRLLSGRVHHPCGRFSRHRCSHAPRHGCNRRLELQSQGGRTLCSSAITSISRAPIPWLGPTTQR